MGRGPISAADLMAELRSDPEWVERDGQKAARWEEQEKLDRAEEASLLSDLAEAGFLVGGISDLVNTRVPYPSAIPALLSHLTRPYSPKLREFVARALGERFARGLAWESVIAAIYRETNESVLDGLFVAISGMAYPRDTPQLIDLIKDERLGPSRVFLVRNLMRAKSASARVALEALRNDPELGAEVARRLRKSTVGDR